MNQEEKQRPHPFRNDFAVQPAFRENGHRLLGGGSLLARLFQLRQKADYNCAYDVTEDEAKSLEEPAHRFVEKIVELIEK